MVIRTLICACQMLCSGMMLGLLIEEALKKKDKNDD